MPDPRIVLVTGASSGIGEAIATRLAKDGHRVFGTSRKGSGPRGAVEMIALDVTSDDSVRSCVEKILREAGRIDVLVNNAGYLLSGAIEEATLEEARAELETNFFGIVRMVKAVLPSMRRARAGHVVAVSSLAGLVPVPFWGFYNASKFAVEGYMETLRHELKPFGIKVALVEPGPIHTPFYENPRAKPMPEYAPWRERALETMAGFAARAPGPEVVAEVVARLVASPNPPLRSRITRDATLFPLLRRLLPASAFEAGTRRTFHLDR
jgi:NAD(P)-dependent dehydrogenase (short-subunit alcohol dehydrogenase family)